jgi:tRNA pseudouridine32 synthase/23S rRNA pseudouridine746 synthase
MLKGLLVDDDPLKNNKKNSELKVLFEDDVLLAIEKPGDILSVPGKEITHSLSSLLKKQFPEIEGPGLVHRLDYETSGVMLVAKTLDIYKALQKQFTSRTIKKKYVAILQHSISLDYGKIDLPLRVDLYNRPRQLVCFKHGKKAQTEFKVLDRTKNSVRVSFFPITGRTHQLRVHAAHKSGLNSPIKGDSLYGASAERLFLHAEEIKFEHPVSGKIVTLLSPAPF